MLGYVIAEDRETKEKSIKLLVDDRVLRIGSYEVLSINKFHEQFRILAEINTKELTVTKL